MEYAAVLSQTYNEDAYREAVLQQRTHTLTPTVSGKHPHLLENVS